MEIYTSARLDRHARAQAYVPLTSVIFRFLSGLSVSGLISRR